MSILENASHIAILGGTHIAAAAGSTVNIRGSSALKDLSAAAAHTAMHDSAARFDAPRCHRNTRARYLDSLELWMLGEVEEFEGKRLIWLNGGAGAGKSAIMQSAIERCSPHGVILGSFFFFRTDTSRNYAEILIPTLAFQLARSFPAAITILEVVIRHDPLIFRASIHTQAYELLVRPILFLFESGVFDNTCPLRRVFLVDGLDECNDAEKQALIIREIATILCAHHVPISFLIASRPEVAIALAFEKEKQLHPIFSSISLDDDNDARSDIRQFVEDSFLDILDSHPWRHLITLPWPDSRSIDALVRRSSGHFIYASTAMKFIASAKEHPERALQIVEGLHPSRTESPFAQLDALYKHVLTSAQYTDQVVAVLRHCYLSYIAPTVAEVCWVHDFSHEDVLIFLFDVQSLVSISLNDKNQLCINPKHASLRDFFEDEPRSQELYLSRQDYHASFLARYFELLDNTLAVPASFCFSTHDTITSLVVNLTLAIIYSQDVNTLQSLISCHSPHDIWNFGVVSAELEWVHLDTARSSTMMSCNLLRLYCQGLCESDIDDELYFEQFQVCIDLILDRINEYARSNSQHLIIPGLIFSSSRSRLFLAFGLLDIFVDQIDHEDILFFWRSALTYRVDHESVDPRAFEALRRTSQCQISWSAELSTAMQLFLQQLVRLSWVGRRGIKYTRLSLHRHWLRQCKALKYVSLGSPRLSSAMSTRLAKIRHDSTVPSECRSPNWDAHDAREECRLLLEAVAYYLRKSDCIIEVVKFARKSLPEAALWYPKLMKKARAEMDAYTRRWDESPDGLFERAQSLSINSMD